MSTLMRIAPSINFGSRRSLRIVERNYVLYKRQWTLFVSGIFEPFFYLLSIGLGLNHLVGPITIGSTTVSYAQFVAPGMMATAAMNGAVIDSLFNTFFKLKISKIYEPVLATPLDVNDVALGEAQWSLTRGSIYAAGFILVMVLLGDARSPWVLACLPAAVLTSFAFAGVGLAACTWLRSWQDFDMVALIQMPIFLFSATFFPITLYPKWLAVIVSFSPLYQAAALMRGLSLGIFSWTMIVHVLYLAAMGVVGVSVAARRFARILVP
jgi:lipooligosaccharide transport system permease protein